MTQDHIFIRFHCETTETDQYVSVSDLIFAGAPIDVEAGEDLEPTDDLIYVKVGEKFISLSK